MGDEKGLVPEIHKVQGAAKVFGTAQCHDGLEIIAAFAFDSDLLILVFRGYFELEIADGESDRLGLVVVDALFDEDVRRAVGEGVFDRFLFEIFEADIALGELSHHDFTQDFDFVFILGTQLDGFFVERDFGGGILEVKAGGDFFFGLGKGVFHFVQFHF